MDTDETNPLARIRQRIDQLDADIHRLLIERSSVIDELIRIKGTSAPGAAFRPDREADMMRRMVMRHEGRLPLFTVEHIWREIITVFTAMQAPFSVVAGPADDPAGHRDVIRYYFGFSVPVENADSEESALEMIAQSKNRIAALALRDRNSWWRSLERNQGAKIFARFPFLLAKQNHTFPPIYIAGPPVKDQAPPDVCLFSLTAGGGVADHVLTGLGGSIALKCGDDYLVEVPQEVVGDDFDRALAEAGIDRQGVKPVGGFARPIEVFSA